MEVERFDESLTNYMINGRKLELREMTIKRTRKLAELMFQLQGEIQRMLKALPQDAPIPGTFSDTVFDCIGEVLTFVFEAAEDPIMGPWVMENLSYRALEAIVKNAAEQSRVPWLPPFFESFYRLSLGLNVPPEMIPRPSVDQAMAEASGSPTTS